jgi:hypothetical protein
VVTEVAADDVSFLVDAPVMPSVQCTSGASCTCSDGDGEVRFGGGNVFTDWQALDGAIDCTAAAFGLDPPETAPDNSAAIAELLAWRDQYVCEAQTIGNGNNRGVEFTITEGLVCPTEVSKTNWLGTGTGNDAFEITQVGNVISARRSDTGDPEQSWGMSLQFECCAGTPMNNVALGGTATHSSECCGGTPARAIDGSIATAWGGGSCTHSGGNDNPDWWQVDLGDYFYIGDINIYQRTDCCSDRLVGAAVHISMDTDYAGGTECFSVADTPLDDTGTCAGAPGRYITVVNTGIVTICELQANGIPAPATAVVPQICECRGIWRIKPAYQICAVQDGVGGLVALGELPPPSSVPCDTAEDPGGLNCNRDFGGNSHPCLDAAYPSCAGFVAGSTWGRCRSVCPVSEDAEPFQPCVWVNGGPLGNNRWPDDYPVYLGATMTRMSSGVGSALVEKALVIANPAISFAAAPAAPTVELAADQATLVATPAPGVVAMQSMAVPCPLAGEVSSRATAFLHHGADYYKFVATASWAENSLESPATSPTDGTPSAPRGLFNAASGRQNGVTCPTAPKVSLLSFVKPCRWYGSAKDVRPPRRPSSTPRPASAARSASARSSTTMPRSCSTRPLFGPCTRCPRCVATSTPSTASSSSSASRRRTTRTTPPPGTKTATRWPLPAAPSRAGGRSATVNSICLYKVWSDECQQSGNSDTRPRPHDRRLRGRDGDGRRRPGVARRDAERHGGEPRLLFGDRRLRLHLPGRHRHCAAAPVP